MFSRRMFTLAVAVAIASILVACNSPSEETSAESPRPGRDWYAGRVHYEINVPEFSSVGTFDGAIGHLDELRELGIQVVVLDPVHPRGGVAALDTIPAHPYSVKDHLAVADELGGHAGFTRFLDAAHARGMRVILDMVLNHGAIDHVAMADHPDWFARTADGQLTRKVTAWRTVADFDHDHAAVRGFHQQVLKTWRARGVDGFRMLHPNLQSPAYWREIVTGFRRSHPDLYLIADGKNPALLEAGFDGFYRPQFFEASTFAILDDLAQPGLQDDMWYAAVDTSSGIGVRGTTFLEDRFGQRATEVFPWPRGQGFVAALLTLPGTPKLYNGQEWGCRMPPRLAASLPLDRAAVDPRWRGLYRDLLALRTGNEALRRGEARRVVTPERELIVFTRETVGELVLVAVNLSDSAPRFSLPQDLAQRRWHAWSDGRFAAEATALPNMIRVEPCGYGAWRAER
jgi:glycosidase